MVEILMTDKDIGVKTLTETRTLSLTTFCLFGTTLLCLLLATAEGIQPTTEPVI